MEQIEGFFAVAGIERLDARFGLFEQIVVSFYVLLRGCR
jgi:hypothetical protein